MMAWPSFGPGETAAPRKRGTLPPRLRGGLGRGWPGSCPTHSHQHSCCFPGTSHDGGAIIWPGRKSGSQEAGGTLPPRLRGGLGRGWPGSCPTHSHQHSCCFPGRGGMPPFSFPRTRGKERGLSRRAASTAGIVLALHGMAEKERGLSRRAASTSLPPRLPCSNLVRRELRF